MWRPTQQSARLPDLVAVACLLPPRPDHRVSETEASEGFNLTGAVALPAQFASLRAPFWIFIAFRPHVRSPALRSWSRSMSAMSRNPRRAFTLVELLVV